MFLNSAHILMVLLHFPIKPDHRYESIDHITPPEPPKAADLSAFPFLNQCHCCQAVNHRGGATNSNRICGWFLCTDLVFAFAYNDCQRSVHAECSSTPFCSIPILHNPIEPPKTGDTYSEVRFRLPANCVAQSPSVNYDLSHAKYKQAK